MNELIIIVRVESSLRTGEESAKVIIYFYFLMLLMCVCGGGVSCVNDNHFLCSRGVINKPKPTAN